jgi:hypothetical protein
MGNITRLREVLTRLDELQEELTSFSDDFYALMERIGSMEDVLNYLVVESLTKEEKKIEKKT